MESLENNAIRDIDKVAKLVNGRVPAMSPYEKYLCAYNWVASFVYNPEKEDEGIDASREVDKVLAGDKIVCVGYANLLKAICDKIGIKCMTHSCDGVRDGKSFGHRTDIVYLDDPKYEIAGVYYADPTWDSRKAAQARSRYTYHAVPLDRAGDVGHFPAERNLESIKHNNGLMDEPKNPSDIYGVFDIADLIGIVDKESIFKKTYIRSHGDTKKKMEERAKICEEIKADPRFKLVAPDEIADYKREKALDVALTVDLGQTNTLKNRHTHFRTPFSVDKDLTK